ncbi:MAG: ATP synthase F0 subunit B [Eubacteriales bacterium]|nr:ATP synthase F0 subunit B [Eubacteriales bacterium]
MPLNIDFLQILLHAFNFLILAGGLTLLLFKPVEKFLNERREHFENAEREIAEKTAENERLRAQYEQNMRDAKDEIARMRADAEKEMAETSKAHISGAMEKAQSIVMNAEKEAEKRKEQILDSAQSEIGDLVVSATKKLLSDTVTPERNSALYDEFIRLAEETVASERASK